MISLYRLLFLPALLLALPYYAFRMWRRGGYGKDFAHRFGRFPRLEPPPSGTRRIWVQAVSVGEVLAVGPLIQALRTGRPVEIVLTTTTSTGYAEARRRYTEVTRAIGVFPLDFWLFSRAAWDRIRPDAIILTESELWPEHLHQAQRRGVPAFLVNARMSDTSFNRYQSIRPLAARLLGKFARLYAASELDRKRLLDLGADSTHAICTGSIKCDVPCPPPLDENGRRTLREELGFAAPGGQPPFVLLGSSTWPGEEEALLLIQKRLIERGLDCRLLLVPRHAERGGELLRLLEKQPLPWHRRSRREASNGSARINLADTTGELARLSQAADLAFIGKSLPPNAGGQTPIEAAALGIPILMGPKMTNFKDIARSLVRAGAARQVPDADALANATFELARDPAARQRMSHAGQEWHARNRGSARRISQDILVQLFPAEKS